MTCRYDADNTHTLTVQKIITETKQDVISTLSQVGGSFVYLHNATERKSTGTTEDIDRNESEVV